MKKILIIDDDVMTTKLLEKLLSDKSYKVEITNSSLKATVLMKQNDYDVIITDLNMPEVNGFELLLWLKKNNIKSKVIIMTSTYLEKSRDFYGNYGVLKYLQKPIKIPELTSVIDSLDKDGFSGDLKNIGLFEYIQMMSISGKDKIVSLKEPLSNKEALVFFKKGRIFHAEYEDLEGDEAFYQIAKSTRGMISEKELYEIDKNTINLPTEALLMNTAQQMDESGTSMNDSSFEKKYKVLIVDDSEMQVKIIKRYLENKNIQVLSCLSALEAVHVLQSETVNMVLCDINMPEVNGFELLLWMKKNKIKAQIVIMTADSNSEYESFALSNGAVRFFKKQFNLDPIYEYIKEDSLNGFLTEVKELGFFDYIQMLIMSQKSHVLLIKSPIAYADGYIYISNSRVLHAEYGDLKGEEAFYKIAEINSGEIIQKEWEEPKEESIKILTPKLLLRTSQTLEQKQQQQQNINVDARFLTNIENKIKSSLEIRIAHDAIDTLKKLQ